MEPWSIGPVTVYPFGAAVAVAAALAAVMTAAQMKKSGLKHGTASWFFLLAVPLAFIFARIGYCVSIIDIIIGDEDWGMILRAREGGFMLWGAIAGGLLAAWLTGKITGQKAGAVADNAVLAACLLISVGRLASGLMFRGVGTGLDIESWFDPYETDPALRYSLFAPEDFSFFERLPFAALNYYDEWCWAVFVPEAVMAALIAVPVSAARNTRPGGRCTLFILLYAAGQITLEACLRGDVLHLPWLGFVRINQVLCAAALLAVWGVCVRGLPKGERKKSGAVSLIQVLLGAGIVVAMEFAAFEKKISAIETVPADVCHLIMLGACVWMALALLPLWRKKYGNG